MTRRLAAAIVVLAGCVVLLRAQDAVLVTREAFLMGTRAQLATTAADRASGLATLETALAILESTEAELTTWRAGSAISRLNAAPPGIAVPLSPPLCDMFAVLYEWQKTTGGTFDPAVGALTAAWRLHDDGRVPTDGERHAAAKKSGLHHLQFDKPGCSIVRRTDATIDVGAFGKGEALDRVAAALAGRSWMIDLGGQVSVGGVAPGQPWTIEIAHPRHRDRAVMRVALADGSLSTSGGSERDLTVNGVRVAHILDPRSGMPASFDGSVTVWHERGLVADLLSTALFVMGPETGLAWAEARGLSVCYLVPDGADVGVMMTSAFKVRLKPDAT